MKNSPLNLGKPSPAGQRMIDAVNETMQRTGWDWNRAWMAVKKSRPELIQAVNEESQRSQREALEQSKPAVETSLPEMRNLVQAVNETMMARRCSFNEAWNLTKQHQPELFQSVNAANEARNERLRREQQARFQNK